MAKNTNTDETPRNTAIVGKVSISPIVAQEEQVTVRCVIDGERLRSWFLGLASLNADFTPIAETMNVKYNRKQTGDAKRRSKNIESLWSILDVMFSEVQEHGGVYLGDYNNAQQVLASYENFDEED